MQYNSTPCQMLRATGAERTRRDARRFVDALAGRLGELESLAKTGQRYQGFNRAEFEDFRRMFIRFRDLCEEFQLLSHVTEDSLTSFQPAEDEPWDEYQHLEEFFRKLQVPMLQLVIRTNLQLLRVWDDRLRRGQGLPYGARERLFETVRVIYNARAELLRPRYSTILDDGAVRDAARANRLLGTLIRKAPKIFNFAGTDPSDLIHEADEDDDRDEAEAPATMAM